MEQETANNLDPGLEGQNTETQAGAGLEAVQEAPEQIPQQSEGQGFQKRINQLTADKYAALRRAEEAERQLSQFQNTQTGPPKPAGGAPSLEEFDYDENAYNAALIEYEVGKRFQNLEQANRERERESFKRQVNANYMKKVAAADLPADFSQSVESLMNSGIPLQEDVVLAIQQAPNAPHVAHYLGKNLNVAAELANMDPITAAMRLGDISARLSAGQTNKNPGPSVPDPIIPVKSGGAQTPKDVFDKSLEEIMAEPD